MGGPRLTRDEFTAMRTIAKARDNNLANMFAGTKLVFGVSARMNSVKGILSGQQRPLQRHQPGQRDQDRVQGRGQPAVR